MAVTRKGETMGKKKVIFLSLFLLSLLLLQGCLSDVTSIAEAAQGNSITGTVTDGTNGVQGVSGCAARLL